MIIDIKEYMKLSREERREHVNLYENCIEIGGTSKEFKGLLAYKLNTTIPHKDKIDLCHACNNPRCSNPNHLYWGTRKDNVQDAIDAKTHIDVRKATIQKFGLVIANQIYKQAAIKAGLAAGERNKLSNVTIAKYKNAILQSEPEKYGWISRVQLQIPLSHTQIARFVKKYCPDITVYKRNY